MVRTTPETIHLWGGRLCLDFANTVDWDEGFHHVEPERTDVLVSGVWARRWAKRVGIPGGGRVSAAELRRLRDLRAVIHRIFSVEVPSQRDLRILGEEVAEGLGAARLQADPEGAVSPAWGSADERRIRFAVAWDAMQLLSDPQQVGRVSRCPGRRCGWLFLNTSGRRRWCSMTSCGSREKMRRAYARKRRSSVKPLATHARSGSAPAKGAPSASA